MRAKERINELINMLPEKEAAEFRWLIDGASVVDKPRGTERMKELQQVLPQSEFKELEGKFQQWNGDAKQEDGIFKWLCEKYRTDCQDEMSLKVFAAYNCMDAEELRRNMQTYWTGWKLEDVFLASHIYLLVYVVFLLMYILKWCWRIDALCK